MIIKVMDIELVQKYQINIQGNNDYVYGVETAGPIFAKEIGKANIEKMAVLCLDHTNKIVNFAIISVGDDEKVGVSM